MTNKMNAALISMGYRDMGKGAYGKPVAGEIFLFRTATREITLVFRGADGQIYVWNRSVLPENFEASHIITEECGLMERFRGDPYKGFSFISLTEVMGFEVGQ